MTSAQKMQTARRTFASVLAAAAVTGLVACGSSDSSSNDSTSVSSGDASGQAVSAAKLAEAKATVEKLSKPSPDITVNTPLAKKPEEGLLLANVYPPNPSQVVNAKAFEQAGEALGFKVENFSVGTTADQMQSAFDAALAKRPVGIWVNAIDPAQWSSSARKMEAAGIKVVNQGSSWPNADGRTLNFLNSEGAATLFSPMGDWAVAEANGEKADTLIVTPAGVAVYDAATQGVEDRIKSLCPSCAVEVLKVALEDMGTKSPDQIVGRLQKNPDLRYVLFPLSGAETGLVPALKAAGLADKVKIQVAAGASEQQAELKQGDIASNLAFDQLAQAYLVVDFMARSLTGESTAMDERWLFPAEFLTKEDVGDPSEQYTAGSPSQWEDLWRDAKTSPLASGN